MRPVHLTLSACAAHMTQWAVSTNWVSRSDSDAGIAAAQRITITPRACDVMYGTTRSFAQALRPATTISRGRLCCAPGINRAPVTIVLRSSGPSVADQLMQISMISPSGRCKAPTSSGSSSATDAVWGHHAPSISAPSGFHSPSSWGRLRSATTRCTAARMSSIRSGWVLSPLAHRVQAVPACRDGRYAPDARSAPECSSTHRDRHHRPRPVGHAVRTSSAAGERPLDDLNVDDLGGKRSLSCCQLWRNTTGSNTQSCP
jgi:hypothetical protein